MYTVILPTMWIAQEIAMMLPLIDAHPLIGEILVINNNIPNTPNWFKNGKWKKVKAFNPPSNIYICPAWNLGVKHAKYDKICILSDDTLFDMTVFDFLYDKIIEDNGCIGLDHRLIYQPHQTPLKKLGILKSPNMKLERAPDVDGIGIGGGFKCPTNGYAMLWFWHKSNYIPIPDQCKNWFGDVFLYNVSKKKGKPPLQLANFFVMGVSIGTTINHPVFKELGYREAHLDPQIVIDALNKIG